MRQPRLDGLTMDETKNTEEHPRPAEQHPESAAGEQDRHEPRDAADGQATAGAGAPAGPTAVELQDRWQRAVAELDNLRKRYERQLDQARRAERDRVTAAWLPVLDHLELALQHAHADPATIVAGIQAVHQQALDVLAGLGYRRVDEVGARFDPTVHEAAQVTQDPDAEPNTVVAVLRPGYTTDAALLRPAVVTVAGGRE
jgi:molecular chaperone GrpE